MAKTQDAPSPSPSDTSRSAPVDWIGVGERLDVQTVIFAIVSSLLTLAAVAGFVLLARLYVPLDHGIGSAIVTIAAILIAVTVSSTLAFAFRDARSRAADRLIQSMAAGEPDRFAHIKQEIDRIRQKETGMNESEAR